MKEGLRSGFLFRQLTDEQLERVARRARMVRVSEGGPLFEQGDAAERFFLVLEGQVKLYRLSPSGNEKVIEVVTPGSTFAEALMFLDRPHFPVGAVALTDAVVISVDSKDFAQMLRSSVETCFLLLGDLSQRLRGLIREIDDLSLQSATSRVAGYFLKKAPPEKEEFDLEVAKGVIASRLSVTPETFSRIVKKLHAEGAVTVSGSRIRIEDRQRLRAAADACAIRADSLEETFAYPYEPGKRG